MSTFIRMYSRSGLECPCSCLTWFLWISVVMNKGSGEISLLYKNNIGEFEYSVVGILILGIYREYNACTYCILAVGTLVDNI